MEVSCPQCGAPAAVQTETRFYRCAYCASSYVVQDEQGIEQYTCSHQRDDRAAWSALAEHLERQGLETELEQGGVKFFSLPFWCFTLDSGVIRMTPAVPSPVPEVAAVTLPGVDLRFPLSGEEFSPPEISLTDAERGLAGAAVTRRFLVYLPLYHLAYTSQGAPCQALVSGADRKVYARSLPSRKGIAIPRRHLLMVGLYALVLVAEGVAIRRLEWRAVAFILTGMAAGALCSPLLRREC